jgi:hypothetical protein
LRRRSLRRRQTFTERPQDGGDRDPGTPHAGDPPMIR